LCHGAGGRERGGGGVRLRLARQPHQALGGLTPEQVYNEDAA